MKHTKGPWTAQFRSEQGTYHIPELKQAEIDAGMEGTDVSHANADLIGEAPAMLEALKIISGWSRCQCVGTHGTNLNCCVLIADNAIAKAEGK